MNRDPLEMFLDLMDEFLYKNFEVMDVLECVDPATDEYIILYGKYMYYLGGFDALSKGFETLREELDSSQMQEG